MRLLRFLFTNNRGATAIEYGLIMALVFLGMIVGITNFGNAAIRLLNNVSSNVSKAS
jgi:pilus assembly protein Flp/PilA